MVEGTRVMGSCVSTYVDNRIVATAGLEAATHAVQHHIQTGHHIHTHYYFYKDTTWEAGNS